MLRYVTSSVSSILFPEPPKPQKKPEVKAAIKTEIKSEKITRKEKLEADIPAMECPITSKSFLDDDAPKTISQISCGHLFETAVIKKILSTKNQCPQCRQQVNPQFIVSVTPEFFHALKYIEKLKTELTQSQNLLQQKIKQERDVEEIANKLEVLQVSLAEKPDKATDQKEQAVQHAPPSVATQSMFASVKPERSVESPEEKLLREAKNGTEQTIFEVLKEAPNINYADEKTGDTALHHIARRGMQLEYKLLVSNHADQDKLNRAGETARKLFSNRMQFGLGFQREEEEKIKLATHKLSRANDEKSAEEAVRAGAKINLPDQLGDTPLHWAAYRGKSDVVRYLIRQKADLTARNHRGRTPLEEMQRGGKMDRECRVLLECPEMVSFERRF